MSPPAYIKVSNVGGGAAPGDVESMRKDLDKILGRDEHGTAQVRMILFPEGALMLDNSELSLLLLG